MLAPLKGHEFHRACVNTGGEFISISPASKSCINVLEIRKIDKSVEETLDGPGIERSELAAKIQRLHIFFALLILMMLKFTLWHRPKKTAGRHL